MFVLFKVIMQLRDPDTRVVFNEATPVTLLPGDTATTHYEGKTYKLVTFEVTDEIKHQDDLHIQTVKRLVAKLHNLDPSWLENDVQNG